MMLIPEDDAAFHNCNSVSEAIRFQGIDDLTSWTFVQACFIMVYSVLLVVGFIGNGSVLMMFAQNKRLRSTRNLFLLNLIITDLLLCLTAIPVTPWYALTKDWKFGAAMCRLVPLSSSCAVFVTSWSLTAIAVDKFWHIMDPTRGRFSLRLAGFVTILIWSVPSVINIPYLLSYELVNGSYYVAEGEVPFCGHFCDELNWQSDTQRRLYGCAVLIFQFVVPMTIITYCYSRILRKVQKDMIVENSQFCGSLTDAQRVCATNRKKRVNYILIGMVFAFIGCNTPLTALNLAKDFKAEPNFMRFQPYLWPLIAHLIAMSAVVWNPFLFFWLTTKEKPIRSSNFGGFGNFGATTSDILNSLASRVQSFRSISGDSMVLSRSKRNKLKSLNGGGAAELAGYQNGMSLKHTGVYYPSSVTRPNSKKNSSSASMKNGGGLLAKRSSSPFHHEVNNRGSVGATRPLMGGGDQKAPRRLTITNEVATRTIIEEAGILTSDPNNNNTSISLVPSSPEAEQPQQQRLQMQDLNNNNNNNVGQQQLQPQQPRSPLRKSVSYNVVNFCDREDPDD